MTENRCPLTVVGSPPETAPGAAAKKGFHELRVWRRAIDLASKIYGVVESLPAAERFGIAEQMRRAAVSVPSNIAEGQARWHRKEFLRHLGIARGSLAELETLLVLAERLNLVEAARLVSAWTAVTEVRMLLSGLVRRLRSPS
jgi:four helix bundle protein